MVLWNLIHGCHRRSEGCKNCYVFARDEQHDIDTNIVRKTASFNLPLKRERKGEWMIPSGSMVMTCFSSDFFIEEMGRWLSMMKMNSHVQCIYFSIKFLMSSSTVEIVPILNLS